MALTYNETQYLLSKNIIHPNWVMTEAFQDELRNFLTTACGLETLESDTDPSIINNAMLLSGILYAIEDTDPYIKIFVIVEAAWRNDELSFSGDIETYRRDNNLDAVYFGTDETSVYFTIGKYTRKICSVNGTIICLYVDPIADVGQQQTIYIGGSFTEATTYNEGGSNGPWSCNNVLKINVNFGLGGYGQEVFEATIDSLGVGFDDQVLSINKIDIPGDDIRICAAGMFNNSGGTPISKVAKLMGIHGPWAAVSADTLPAPVNVIKQSPGIDAIIYIGTDIATQADAILRKLDTGSWVPVIFPEIVVNTPDNWLFNGSIKDIDFKEDGTKAIIVGNFTAHNGINTDEDLIVFDVDVANANNVMHAHQFNAAGTLNKVKYNGSDTLIVSGAFTDISFENPIQSVPAKGICIISQPFTGFIPSTLTALLDSNLEYIENFTHMLIGNILYVAGDFDKSEQYFKNLDATHSEYVEMIESINSKKICRLAKAELFTGLSLWSAATNLLGDTPIYRNLSHAILD